MKSRSSPSEQSPLRGVSTRLEPLDVQSLRQESLSVEERSVAGWITPEACPVDDLFDSLVVNLPPKRIDPPKIESRVFVESVGSVEKIEDDVGDRVDDAELKGER